MKHSRISLLERAAEIYDFGAPLRAPSANPVPSSEEELTRELPAEARAADPVEIAAIKPPAAMPRPLRSTRPPAETGAFAQAKREIPAGEEGLRPAGRAQPDAIATIDRAILAEAGYIVPEAAVTGLAEEFRLIKRQLISDLDRRTDLPEEKRRSILIASGQSGEGKSFCALNLALSLSGEQEVEVLLVDGDFSKQDLLSLLGIPAGPGLVDALADPFSDPEDFVIRTDVAGLSILPAGRKANNVPELLASERTREVLARLIAHNPRRLILFDSPPALMASPASLFAGLVGQVLVVVRADQTHEGDLRETVGLLSGCDHIGLLLNGAAINVSGRNYGAYDGYHHAD